MRIQDFPRPKGDNRRGIHWSASVYHPIGSALDFWIDELKAMHIKWVKLLDDSGGSSLALCQRLLAAEIMPIVRLYRAEPNPGHIGGREEDTLRRLIDVGVRYFETNNEPDLAGEWIGNRMPPNWLDVVIDNFIIDADKVIGLGGLPALPAMGVGSRDNPVARVMAKGRADLFEKGAWVAIHNYTLDHPLDYPYDAVNQTGAPVSQEEYDRLGSWAWEARPREMVNQWRASDKNPGATLATDAACFLGFELVDEMIVKALGYQVPIISTEGGPIVGSHEDRRYPRVNPQMHAEWVVAINDFLQGGREIHGKRCPGSYFTMCHWLLANYRLGYVAPGWETQSWYTDWWNAEFNLSGQLPVVMAVKAMPSLEVRPEGNAVVAGQLLRADTGEPLPGLPVRLMANGQECGNASSAANGAFRFEKLTPGLFDLEVAPWGVVRRGVTAAPEPVQPVVIRLAGGQNSVLSGQVLSNAGTPQAGIRVTLKRAGLLVSDASTAADGMFRFTGLPLGSYQLLVPGITISGIALDGWNAKSLKLTSGPTTGYRYVVTKQRLLSAQETASRHIFYGSVTDAGGTGMNGIRIEMGWQGAAPGTVFPTKDSGHDPYKPAGSFEFSHTPGLFRLQVVQGDWPSNVADNLETARVPGREGQPIAYEVCFQLQAVGSAIRVDGAVPGGQPGTRLRLISASKTLETALANDATFAFADVPPGSYRLEMVDMGILAEGIMLGPGALYRVIFPMRSRLSGQVLEPTQGLIAVLYAPPALGWTRQSPLDPAGRFTFEGLPPGKYRLQVADQILPDIELTGENLLQLAPIDLTLGRRSVVRGVITVSGGGPKANALVILRREGVVVAQVRSGTDGTYRFANLPSGTYSLEVEDMGTVSAGILLDGRNEQVRDVIWIPAGPRGVIQGRVLAADGTPQPGLAVRLLRGGTETEVARAQTDNTGAFRFTALADGTYDLAVGNAGPLVTALKVENGCTITRDITLPAPADKPITRYLLLPQPLQGASNTAIAEAELALTLGLEYLRRSGASGGFSLADAAHAREVVIVGDQIPATADAALQAAGCQVSRLTGDGYALAAAFDKLPTV